MNQIEPQDKFPTFRRIGRKLKRVRIGRKLLRVGKWIGKAILVLLVIGVVANGIASFVLGRRLAAKIEAIKAEGGIIALADFGKPKVPDSENAAVVYDKAFKLISTDQARKDLRVLDDFLRSAERASRPELWDQARSATRKYSAVIPIVEEAVKRPRCQYPVNWEAGPGLVLPHLAKVRQLVRILDSDAILQARDGNMDEAVRSLQLSYAVGESLKDEAHLISQLVRISANTMISRALLEVVETGKIGEAQARRLYDALGERDFGAGFAKSMQCERAMGIWIFNSVRWRRLDFARMFVAGPDPRGISQVRWALFAVVRFLWRPISYADEILYLDAMNRIVAHASRPFRTPHPPRLRAQLDPDFPRYAIISQMMFPVFSGAKAKCYEAQARTAGDRIMLALITYKGRYGAYPASLSDLRAKLGWKIEEDAFSGKDFIYRPKGAGFLLYSVGQNLKDDGARVEPPKVLPPPQTPGAPPGGPPAPATQLPNAWDRGFVYTNAKGEQTADIIWELER